MRPRAAASPVPARRAATTSWCACRVRDEGEDLRRGTRPPRGVGVLDRSAAILRAVEDGARSFTASSEATGLTSSTAHRLIPGLEAHGFLASVGGVGYALGPSLLALATSAVRDLPFRELARPALEQLARTTGRDRAALRPPRRRQDLRRCRRVRKRAPHHRRDRRVLPLTRVGREGVPRMGPTTPGRGLRRGPAASNVDLHDPSSRWPTATASASPASRPSAPRSSARTIACSRRSVSGPRSRIAPLQAKRYGPAVVEAAKQVERLLGRGSGGATRRRPRAPGRPGPGRSCRVAPGLLVDSLISARAATPATAPRCVGR